MRRRNYTIIASVVLMLGASTVPAMIRPGHIFLAEEPGAVWYLDAKNVAMRQYENDELLDAAVFTFRYDGTSKYIEKNLWHLDLQNDRYKVSATSSYDCEGNELGT